VLVAPADQLPEREFKYVYLLGLKEGEFPFIPPQGWLYNDTERKILARVGLFPAQERAEGAERYLFYAAVSSAGEGLWLSASLSGQDIKSSYLAEALCVAPSADFIRRAATQVLPALPLVARADILTAALVSRGRLPLGALSWLAGVCGEDFYDRVRCELPERRGEYAGRLGRAKEDVNALFNLTYTPSALDSYAACPFRFLTEYVWRPADWQRADEYLRAEMKGNIYHECLRRFYRPLLGKPWPREESVLLGALETAFAAAVDDFTARGRLSATWLTGEELSDMRQHLSVWLRAETDYRNLGGGFQPCLLEWRFGGKTGEDAFTVDCRAGKARLSGQIDRVDADGQNFFVTDYKKKVFPGGQDALGGRDWQIPSYLLAVDRFLGEPMGGGYFSVENARRGGGVWHAEAKERLGWLARPAAFFAWDGYRRTLFDVLAILIQQINDGYFPPRQPDGCPAGCPAALICRREFSSPKKDRHA
jgi:ATP-dependent helicase/nuclease subunit B